MTEADRLLISVLKHHDEKTFTRVKQDWLDVKERKKFEWVRTYYKEHGELPGVKSFCGEYSLDRSDIDSRPTVYFRRLKERFITTELADNLPGLIRKVTSEPNEVISELKELAARLSIEDSTSKDSKYSDDAEERYAEMEKRGASGGISYLSMGNPILDKVFHGYDETDLITIAGRAGAKKTWLLCLLALLAEAVLPPEYEDILFVTNEMSMKQIKGRMDCIRFSLPFTQFLEGRLSRAQKRVYREGLDRLKKEGSRIQIVEFCLTTEELESKIGIYAPSTAFVDGSYLLDQHIGNDWKQIQFVTRNLKRIANTHKVPITNTTQLGRNKGKNEKSTSFDAQDEFSFGMGFVMDSDLAIRLFQDKQMIFRQEVGVQIAKGRNVILDSDLVFLANLYDMSLAFDLREAESVEEMPFT